MQSLFSLFGSFFTVSFVLFWNDLQNMPNFDAFFCPSGQGSQGKWIPYECMFYIYMQNQFGKPPPRLSTFIPFGVIIAEGMKAGGHPLFYSPPAGG